RIVEAADLQRRRIEQELREGAGRRLECVGALLADAGSLAAVEAELAEARRELEEFARGVHPAALTDGGLMPALALLAQRSAIPVELTGSVARLPEPVEATLFFVCSEALANVAKHAAAAHVVIELRVDELRASRSARLVVTRQLPSRRDATVVRAPPVRQRSAPLGVSRSFWTAAISSRVGASRSSSSYTGCTAV